MDWSGEILAGRYRVESKLDEGGMGSIYLARDQDVRGRRVVVKVPHKNLLTAEFQARFDREIDQLVALEHPRIVHVYSAGRHNDSPYLVVQYLSGGDLADRTGDTAPPPLEVARWLDAIADALDFVHRRGRVHRDVKPGNILFDAEGYAYLSDFGIATVMTSIESTGEVALTRAGAFVGSVPYAPPEAIARKFTPQYDQYSLGLVVYRTLSGSLPFDGRTASEVLKAKMSVPPEPIQNRIKGIGQGAANSLMKALSMNPEDRFDTCRDFARAFEAGLSDKPAKPIAPPKPAKAKARPGPVKPAAASGSGAAKKQTPTLALGAVAVLLAVLLALLLFPGGEDPEAPPPAPEPTITAETLVEPEPPIEPVESVEEAAEGTEVEELPPETLEVQEVEPPERTPDPVAPPPPALRRLVTQRDLALFASRTGGEVVGLVAEGQTLDANVIDESWSEVSVEGVGKGFVRTPSLGAVAPPAYTGPRPRLVTRIAADAQGPGFRIDTREVPLRAYRLCVADGRCSAAATGPGCRGDEAPRDEPVNCVDFDQAERFCAWAGKNKRPPSEGEWLRAAAAEPGMLDATGGVAEWTSTTVGRGQKLVREGPGQASSFPCVRGCQFPDLGFRCAAAD